jgi:pimeloyl-ACP methyl ester carboxylesterase
VLTRFIVAQPPGLSATRIVMLPGAYQGVRDFVAAGFDSAIRARRLALDLMLIAPALTHVTDRDWIARLHDEVVWPSRAAGHTLWIGGISLGAFMALRFAAQYPAQIDGLCLIAPYLGSRMIAADIARHQSLKCWQPGEFGEDDDERHIWRYIRGLEAPPPRVFLGLGTEDRFADTQRVLARALPASSTQRIAGAHEWHVWRQLWEHFLDRHDVALTGGHEQQRIDDRSVP